MFFYSSHKWGLTFRVIPWVALVVITKVGVHTFGLEQFALNALTGALVSANVFLIGFLIAGVLADYKESERLPGEIACSLESIFDEVAILYKKHKAPVTRETTDHIKLLTDSVMSWLHKDERTTDLMTKVSKLSDYFCQMEPLTQATFLARLKQEQSALRRAITRIHTIRETEFNPAGYAIAEVSSFTLCIALILTDITPYYEGLAFLGFISFILIYMVLLIKELDNPFSYYERESVVKNISLKPLKELRQRLDLLEQQP